MVISRRFGLVALFFVVNLALGVTASCAAWGGTLRFLAQVEGESRQATAESVDVEGVTYVPLDGVSRQFGAACAAESGNPGFRASVRVVFAGRAARIGINDNTVEASLKRFSLRHTLLQRNGEILMAAIDIPTFFEHAFGLKVAQETSTPPSKPDPTSAATDSPGRTNTQQLAEPDAELALSSADEMLNLPPGAAETRIPAPTVLTVRSIIIDPGHGGADTGCRGRTLAEKDLTLTLAKRVQELAQATPGLTVLLTRDSDTEKTIDTRVNFAKLTRADVFVSLHAGASLASAAHGFEIFYSPHSSDNIRLSRTGRAAESRVSAETRVSAASLQLGTALAEGLVRATSAENRGIHQLKCRILNELPMPGVLLEVGCLTNPSEEELLQTDDYQTRIAQGILAQIRPPTPIAPPAPPLPTEHVQESAP